MVRPVTDDDIGLKILREPLANTPEEAAQIIDIVAIHGIGAHPDDTWCKNVGTESKPRYINWLKDVRMLPSVASNARVLRYGYESQWFGKNAIRQKASTVAERLLLALKREREEFPYRPMIFIAHCFGGLVLLKALLEARHHVDEWPGIFDSTTGLIFFGTPFRGAEGMTQTEMLEAARTAYNEDQVEEEVLKILEPGNEFLQDLVDQFGKIQSKPNKAQVACLYELKPSNVGAIVGGKLRMKFVVSETSGCLDLSDSTAKFSLSRTHFNMNKFGKTTEEDFQTVRDILRRMTVKARELVVARSQSKRNTFGPERDRLDKEVSGYRAYGSDECGVAERICTAEREWMKLIGNRKRRYRCLNCGSGEHWEYECRDKCGKCLYWGHKATQCEFPVRCMKCMSSLVQNVASH
ncbi:hypothetical protein K469DRAFT_678515 [Zopfia rhizophila CBS 207.26]|uniref:CCHC-type domain-containing protein n=1 Tax=Zopfia rhizophila CBS 207.26 TaxID=1314779 RepID=A0A6A6DEF9_9PEZI|nr:hypothetical protein K469DRAFT_678515 [Zopfia rhizophila CBS 207.26]